jgi:hypothetical protein
MIKRYKFGMRIKLSMCDFKLIKVILGMSNGQTKNWYNLFVESEKQEQRRFQTILMAFWI